MTLRHKVTVGCSRGAVSIIDPPPQIAAAFALDRLAELLSVGFIGSIDRRAERGSANGSESSQSCVDPRDAAATGAPEQRLLCVGLFEGLPRRNWNSPIGFVRKRRLGILSNIPHSVGK